MKHAGASALDSLEPLLAQIRGLPGLREKARGVFYWKGRAFLHFHEDPKGVFGDVRDDGGVDFDRFEVTGASGQTALMSAARARLSRYASKP